MSFNSQEIGNDDPLFLDEETKCQQSEVTCLNAALPGSGDAGL